MDERILRLKRWLHRTRLREYEFQNVLMKKRCEELVRIAKGDGSAIKKGQLPDARIICDERQPWSLDFGEVDDYRMFLHLDGGYELLLCGNKYEPHYRFSHGWISSAEYDTNWPYYPFGVNPYWWLKFNGWPTEYLERLMTVLPDMAKEWKREDEYIEAEFVKKEKIRAIRQKVEYLKAQRKKM